MSTKKIIFFYFFYRKNKNLPHLKTDQVKNNVPACPVHKRPPMLTAAVIQDHKGFHMQGWVCFYRNLAGQLPVPVF
jgi:hypothetical protein